MLVYVSQIRQGDALPDRDLALWMHVAHKAVDIGLQRNAVHFAENVVKSVRSERVGPEEGGDGGSASALFVDLE